MMVGLTALATMGLVSSSYQKRQIQINSVSKLTVDVLQQNYSMYIQDDESWKKTLNDPANTSFSCLLNATPCSRTPQPITILRNARDEVVVDTSPQRGVMTDGSLCDGFYDPESGDPVPTNANPSCTMHVGLTWKPICKGACIGPAVIQVNISISKAAAANSAARFIASSAAGILRAPSSMPVATAVGVGHKHTCAIASGDVYCWGESTDGKLGPASTGANFLTPVKVTGLPSGVTKIDVNMFSACALQGGNVYCWGRTHGANPMRIEMHTGGPLTNIVEISVGLHHSCALNMTGAAFCWGDNSWGQLGFAIPPTQLFVSNYNTWSAPNGPAFPVIGLSRGLNGPDLGTVKNIHADFSTSCAAVDLGARTTMMCWGINEHRGGNGNLQFEPYFNLSYRPWGPMPAAVPTAKGYKTRDWPNIHRNDPVPLVSDPMVMNGFYSLTGKSEVDSGICNPKPEESDSPLLQSDIKQIVGGYSSACALKTDGSVVCWAFYDYGRCAHNPATGAACPVRAVTTITGVEKLAHHERGYFALKNGELWAWGHNRAPNALGDPNGVNYPPYFTYMSQPFKVGGIPQGSVTNIQGGATDQGDHNCAVAAGKIYCWGGNSSGQLGDGTTTDHAMGDAVMVTKWP